MRSRIIASHDHKYMVMCIYKYILSYNYKSIMLFIPK